MFSLQLTLVLNLAIINTNIHSHDQHMQKVLEMIHRNGEESYAKLPLQSCVPGTVVVAQTEFVF